MIFEAKLTTTTSQHFLVHLTRKLKKTGTRFYQKNRYAIWSKNRYARLGLLFLGVHTSGQIAWFFYEFFKEVFGVCLFAIVNTTSPLSGPGAPLPLLLSPSDRPFCKAFARLCLCVWFLCLSQIASIAFWLAGSIPSRAVSFLWFLVFII